jgi:transposase
MRYVQPADRRQFVLMNTLDDLVPASHPVRIIDTVVEQIVTANHDEFVCERDESDPGRPAFAPQTMLKLFLYGYLINCRASRKLETETKRNIELLWLLGTLSPDHWVIARYRREHGAQIKAVAKAFRQFLHAHEYIKGERVAIDGTKMKANAKREMLSMEKIEKRLHRLDEQLEEYLKKLAENDLRDDLAEELDNLDSSVVVDEYLLNKIIALQKQVEELTAHKATLEQSGKAHLSPSDPDALLMKTTDGKVPGYNVQLAVDDAYHMIAAAEVLTKQNDRTALPHMVEAIQKELGITPNEVVADKDYCTPDLLQQIETTTGATCYVATPEKDEHASPVTFHYDASTDSYTCSAGRVLVLYQKNKRKRQSLVNVYRGIQCSDCSLRAQCTTSKHARIVHRYHNQDWREQFRERMKQASSKAIIGLRKCLVEHPFGTIKAWGGKLPLLLRGLPKVATEVNLYATAYNLRRLFHCATWETLTEQIGSHSWRLA